MASRRAHRLGAVKRKGCAMVGDSGFVNGAEGVVAGGRAARS